MKKRILTGLLWTGLLLTVLLLTGCSQAADPHPEWDDSWVRIAEAIGVEPMEGFTLNESNDVLATAGLYYATWTCGEGQEFVNEAGEDAVVYDAQIYVLLEECSGEEEARQEVESWIAREKESYESEETGTRTLADQEYEILSLVSGREENPYGYGTAAFAVRGSCAVSVELVCSERYAGDPQDTMTQFLNGFHYGDR